MTANTSTKTISFEQLAHGREKTEQLSRFLTQRLQAHLATLYPILNPKRVFGKYLGSRDSVPKADESYAQLTEKFRECSGRPFDLRADLDEQTLGAMEHGTEVYPWEYTHVAGSKEITIACPFRWVVTFRSEYTLAQLRAFATGKGERRTLALRQFLANAIAMQIVLARNPGVGQLLEDLGYEIQIETGPGLGKLPLLTLSARLPSFRPSDELLVSATHLSGIPAFVELIDTEAVPDLTSPLHAKIVGILAD